MSRFYWQKRDILFLLHYNNPISVGKKEPYISYEKTTIITFFNSL